MTYIVVGRNTCGFCKAAIELLKTKHIPYEFYEIECYDKSCKLWKQKPESHKTVPVIFYNDCFIGGYSELCKYIV